MDDETVGLVISRRAEYRWTLKVLGHYGCIAGWPTWRSSGARPLRTARQTRLHCGLAYLALHRRSAPATCRVAQPNESSGAGLANRTPGRAAAAGSTFHKESSRILETISNNLGQSQTIWDSLK